MVHPAGKPEAGTRDHGQDMDTPSKLGYLDQYIWTSEASRTTWAVLQVHEALPIRLLAWLELFFSKGGEEPISIELILECSLMRNGSDYCRGLGLGE